MTDYVPMYDNVGQKQQATSAFSSDVTYAKLSPDTLLKKRTVSEQYQVPVTEHGKKHQKKSGSLIAAMSVLLTLLSVGTITAVILASVEYQHINKLSIQNIELSGQLEEIKKSMATMKEDVTNLQGRLTFSTCFKETTSCNILPWLKINPYCETAQLPVNKTVSCWYTVQLEILPFALVGKTFYTIIT